MISIPGYEGYGRKILVEFTCRRCGAKACRPLKDAMPTDAPPSHMSNFRAPSDWRDGGFYYSTFCPDCAKKYDEFMRGEDNV